VIPFLVVGLFSLTGCSNSSNSEPEYDPVEVLEYEFCLNNPPPQFEDQDGDWLVPGLAEQYCESKKPIAK
jgi:hypothetical protein